MKQSYRAKMNYVITAALTLGVALVSAHGQQHQHQHPGADGKPKEAKTAMLEHKYADVNGVRLHYVTAGKGKLIMFVHGFPEFWYEWKN
ncbi:MAG TPA: hypothetical protein VN687_08445, partial [Blastocatellia bacterium]|nr:hypothetical protein [Blastocatellia bacterium]